MNSGICQAIHADFSQQKVGSLVLESYNSVIERTSKEERPKALDEKQLIYEGRVTIFFGEPGCGKTAWLTQAMIGVAEKQTVIDIDCEMSDYQIEMRYNDRESGDRLIFPEGFIRATVDPDALADKGPQAIIDSIREICEKGIARIFAVDNISYLCNDQQNAEEATKLMQDLIALKRKFGLTLIVVAHPTKRAVGRELVKESLFGSSKIAALADEIFAIGGSIQGDDIRYIKQVKVRDDETRYGARNVILYRMHRGRGWLSFEEIGCGVESDHLAKTFDSFSDHDYKASEVRRCRDAGLSYQRTAEETGMSVGTVYYLANPKKKKASANDE